jgi:hypothetical protein
MYNRIIKVWQLNVYQTFVGLLKHGIITSVLAPKKVIPLNGAGSVPVPVIASSI